MSKGIGRHFMVQGRRVSLRTREHLYKNIENYAKREQKKIIEQQIYEHKKKKQTAKKSVIHFISKCKLKIKNILLSFIKPFFKILWFFVFSFAPPIEYKQCTIERSFRIKKHNKIKIARTQEYAYKQAIHDIKTMLPNNLYKIIIVSKICIVSGVKAGVKVIYCYTDIIKRDILFMRDGLYWCDFYADNTYKPHLIIKWV